MSQTPSPESVVGQGPASSTTHWGKAPPVPEIRQIPSGTAEAQFRAGTGS